MPTQDMRDCHLTCGAGAGTGGVARQLGSGFTVASTGLVTAAAAAAMAEVAAMLL